jgi:anti-sigma regulatory factor (Ser/Thr protein kinase)
MKITISSEPKLLRILRGAVRWQARENGFSETEADCLALAIDEAACNVIQHTYSNRPGMMLSLEMFNYPDRIEFILEDSGPKVKADSVRPRALDDLRPGGLGTLFIQTFVDSSCYDASYCEGNRLKLVKFLPGKAPRKE